MRVQPRLRAKPIESVRHDAKPGPGEPHHRATDEDRKQRYPRAVQQHQHRRDGDVEPDRNIDAAFQIPLVRLHPIPPRFVGAEHRPEAEQLQNIADGTKPGKSDADGNESCRGDSQDTNWIH